MGRRALRRAASPRSRRRSHRRPPGRPAGPAGLPARSSRCRRVCPRRDRTAGACSRGSGSTPACWRKWTGRMAAWAESADPRASRLPRTSARDPTPLSARATNTVVKFGVHVAHRQSTACRRSSGDGPSPRPSSCSRRRRCADRAGPAPGCRSWRRGRSRSAARLPEVVAHSFPDGDHSRVVSDGADEDGPIHRCDLRTAACPAPPCRRSRRARRSSGP